MSVEADRSDDNLLERLRLRDETALAALVGSHAARLAGTVAATWPMVSATDKEEIVADVIADAWFNADEVDPARATLATWLAMRAKYRTLDRLRRVLHDQGLVARLARLRHMEGFAPEYSSDLDQYLAGLTDLERKLVWLRFIEGRPVAQVGARCGLTPKAVERRLARLRDRLRRRCGPEAIGGNKDA
jgi:RNA polymerase sigma-70 factor, ECF subfamily